MKHKILIVVDAQNDFIDGSLRNKNAQAKVANIAGRVRDFDGEYIFVTRDTHDDGYLKSKEGEKLAVPHCIKGTEGWFVNKEVTAALHKRELDESCIVRYVDKPTFGSLELCYLISAIPGELEIEIVGFCTDICVVSNAILVKAAVYDRADINVIEDCCAGTTPENHFAACVTMRRCQINVI